MVEARVKEGNFCCNRASVCGARLLLTHTSTWALVFLIPAMVFAYLLALLPRLAGGDDAAYVMLGKSLAAGLGYRALNLPGNPPHLQWPPGLPALLTPVWWLFPGFPGNLPWLQLVPLFFGALSAGLIYVLLKREMELGERLAAFIALVVGLQPLAIFFSAQAIYSEMPYLFLSLLALISLGQNSPLQRRWAWVLGALVVAAAYYVRTVGLALIAAGLLWLALQRRWRMALVFVVTVMIVLAPWIYRNQAVGSGALTGRYMDIFLARDWRQPHLGNLTWPELPIRMAANLWGHVVDNVPVMAFPTLSGNRLVDALRAHGLFWLVGAVGLALTALMLVGFLTRLRTGPSLLEWYVIFYMALILPPAWHETRNLFPIWPLLLGYGVLGARRALDWAAAWRPRWAKVAQRAVPLALVLMLASGLLSDRHHWQRGLSFWRGDWDDESHNPFFAWVRQETAPDTVFLGGEKFYLYTGRKGFEIPPLTDPEQFLAQLRAWGVQYVPYNSDCEEGRYGVACPIYLRPFVEHYRPQLAVVWQAPLPSSLVVYRVDGLVWGDGP
jgi:hypothetical protein